MSSFIGRHAVVIGAGMGGLTAARALADHFERVLVLERDVLPAEPLDRHGVPQGRHVHALLAGGQRALEELFPGFEDGLARAGAVRFRVGLDVRVERPGFDPFPQRDFGFDAHAMSRPLVELTVRQRVRAWASIDLRQGCRVQALVHRADGAAVTGVRYTDAEGRAESVDADLVFDASGRGTPTLEALAALGRVPPEETTIGVDLAYASGVFAHYERLENSPRGVLPIGDAICRFNPVYGQGMSVAAQEARALGRLLAARARERDPLAGLAPQYFAEVARLVDTPWAAAAIPDFVHPDTRGERPADLEQTLKFGVALGKLAARDPAVHRLTAEVQHLLKPRSVYQDPTLVQRVLAVMAN